MEQKKLTTEDYGKDSLWMKWKFSAFMLAIAFAFIFFALLFQGIYLYYKWK